MNVNGTVKLLNIVEDGKVLKGKVYFANNIGTKEEPKWETDFINAKFVGKAKEFLMSVPFDVEKMKVNVLSAKLRNRNYIDKSGNHASWLEITVFENTDYKTAVEQNYLKIKQDIVNLIKAETQRLME